jgi:hypothetical protein
MNFARLFSGAPSAASASVVVAEQEKKKYVTSTQYGRRISLCQQLPSSLTFFLPPPFSSA